MKTLEQFRASRVETADIAKLLEERNPGIDHGLYPEDGPLAGYVYDGDCYIYKMDDGRVVLTVYNHEVTRPNADHLPELEARLYEWSITECFLSDETVFDRDEGFTIVTACTFVDKILRAVGHRTFDEICYRNLESEYKDCCATHDFRDANMDMYDAYVETCEIFKIAPADDLNDALPAMNAAWDFAKANLMKPIGPRLVEDDDE